MEISKYPFFAKLFQRCERTWCLCGVLHQFEVGEKSVQQISLRTAIFNDRLADRSTSFKGVGNYQMINKKFAVEDRYWTFLP